MCSLAIRHWHTCVRAQDQKQVHGLRASSPLTAGYTLGLLVEVARRLTAGSPTHTPISLGVAHYWLCY